MRVDFTRVSKDGQTISLDEENVKFTALISKLSENKVKCEGKIQGELLHTCDRCGDEFNLHIDEDVEIFAYNGMAKSSEDKLENIIEFFDGFIDFDEIFISELEAIKSDYFYCKNCT